MKLEEDKCRNVNLKINMKTGSVWNLFDYEHMSYALRILALYACI